MTHPIAHAQVRGWYGRNRAWLQQRCKAAGIRGYSRMTRHQMIEALVSVETSPATVPARLLDEQHPRTADGRWMAHCNACGTYVDDWTTEPPVDFLCDECQEDGDEPDEETSAP